MGCNSALEVLSHTLLFPANPATTLSTIVDSIHKILYTCRTRQNDWTQQTPIESRGIKSTDAADLGYLDTPGFNDRVLDYEGIIGSTSCRLSVRLAFQTLDASLHAHIPFSVPRGRCRKLQGATYTLLTGGILLSPIASF